MGTAWALQAVGDRSKSERLRELSQLALIVGKAKQRMDQRR